MRVLITGGAGFIGSSVAAALLARGDEPILFDSFDDTLYGPAYKHRNLAWLAEHGHAPLVRRDIRSATDLDTAFAEHAPDHVLHLAALAGVRPSLRMPGRYYDVNVVGTSQVLEATRRHGLDKVVVASSSSVYGGNTKTPFAETDPVTDPCSAYAASKRATELACHTHTSLHGGHVTCLRFFTVYGPRQRPDMACHKFMRLLSRGQAIPMFGDGTTARDYTYIDDIVRGVLAALDRPNGFQVYNLGGDEVISLSTMIAAIGDVVGVTPRIEQLPMQPGDVRITNADLARSRAELDYAPRVDLREGLARMWDWYRGPFGPT